MVNDMKIDNNYNMDLKIKRKKYSLLNFLLAYLFLSFFIILTIIAFIGGIVEEEMSLFFSGLFVLIFFYFSIEHFIIKYYNYLIYGREDITIHEEGYKNKNKKNIVSVTEINDNNSRVEGIVGDRERDIIDKDDDGYILVHEFYPLTEPDVLVKVMKKDTAFSKKDFYDYVKNLFMLMQEAWTNNDYFKLRSFEADRLYYRHKREIERLIAAEEKDIRVDVKVKGVMLKDFRIENNKQILVVALTANMRRIYGDDDTQEDYPYIMAFSRNIGVKTNSKVKLSVSNCCNCGAEVNVSDKGVCKYCDTSLVSGEHEWVLVDMKLINIDMTFKKKKN